MFSWEVTKKKQEGLLPLDSRQLNIVIFVEYFMHQEDKGQVNRYGADQCFRSLSPVIIYRSLATIKRKFTQALT